MPSGAKKRKAAKRKKEQQANHNQSNSNSHLGHEDPKSQDERESDGGEAGSPSLQDHHNHQNPFKENNREFEKRDPTPTQSFDSDNKSMDEVAQGLEGSQKVGAANIERELKSVEDSGSQSIIIQHVEFVKESHEGSSSSRSSDNESQVVKKTMMKAASQNGEYKPVNSFLKEVIQSTDKASLGENGTSDAETVKPLVIEPEEVMHVTQGDSDMISVVCDGVESLKNNKESKRNEEKVIPLMEENVGASSDVVETVTKENGGKILPTSDTPTIGTSNGGEILRDSEVPNSSENQPLIDCAPRGEQRTSWMSCCGLFDVLTGSSR